MSKKQKLSGTKLHSKVQPKTDVLDSVKHSPLYKFTPLLIMAFTALIYFKGINNGLTNFDDDFYINNNPFLRDFSLHGVWAIFTSFYTSNYHPLTTLTFLFEYNFFELSPLPYHLHNIVLHVVNTGLVFILIQKLSGKRVIAIVVSLLFALHPMHVESVAWVSERKDVLYAAFYLSSTILYLKYLSNSFNKKFYLLSLLLFTASLLSKSAAVTLPVLFIAIDLYNNRKIDLKSLLEKLPFFILAILFGILNIMAQSKGGSINNLMSTYGTLNRVFLFTTGPAFYLIKLVLPYNLCAMHYFPEVTNGYLPWQYYMSLPFLLLFFIIVLWKWTNRKEIIFGVGFFIITISVMLQFVSFGSAIASERYTYIPYIGLFFIAGHIFDRNLQIPKFKSITIATFSSTIIIFSYLTWERIGIWKDGIILFTDVVEKYPNINVSYWMRGNLQKQAGNIKEAVQDYTQSIKLNPKDDDSYYNRGKIYDETGNPKLAIQDYSQAIKINPKLPDAYNNRGWAYFETGDTANAMKDYNNAITLKPNYADAYNNRGWAFFKAGNMINAETDFSKAINLKPEFLKPYFNRAALYAITGNYKNSLKDYNSIINMNQTSADAFYYRGITYLNLRDTSLACLDLKKAKELGFDAKNNDLKQYCR